VLNISAAIVSSTDNFVSSVQLNKYQPNLYCDVISTLHVKHKPVLGSLSLKKGSTLKEPFNIKLKLQLVSQILCSLHLWLLVELNLLTNILHFVYAGYWRCKSVDFRCVF